MPLSLAGDKGQLPVFSQLKLKLEAGSELGRYIFILKETTNAQTPGKGM